VLALQAVHDLREPVLNVREGHLLSSYYHSHKYSYFRWGETSGERPMPRVAHVADGGARVQAALSGRSAG
jgi:hypothetical protein